MFQQLVLIGNLGKEPTMRYAPSGDPVTSFSMATSKKWTGADGQPVEQTIWWKVSVWGKMAEACNQYLAKGKKVFVEGEITVDAKTGQPRIWTAQDGTPHASLEVRASRVIFLSPKDGNGAPEAPAAEAPSDSGDDL